MLTSKPMRRQIIYNFYTCLPMLNKTHSNTFKLSHLRGEYYSSRPFQDCQGMLKCCDLTVYFTSEVLLNNWLVLMSNVMYISDVKECELNKLFSEFIAIEILVKSTWMTFRKILFCSNEAQQPWLVDSHLGRQHIRSSNSMTCVQ